ncbi:transglutaminase-like cysteine peptidase [Bradyrhizobium sp. CCBAU 51627]|uniref:transglutaminase-like cysteine peptidase n=1 Tax=Bradyrhizobium sp. CCBAU 51627 TaxID=1325088 RepID=UPI00230570EB|nr:transglutaminase-like cysteine peptidase [Bradyrhizobium sp. CCBAU 51627]MDA9432246.1 transglutaminase [Bradyrhizobium sp. CCBAU 51627]
MKPRLGMRKSGPFALATALFLGMGSLAAPLATSSAFADELTVVAEASQARSDGRETEVTHPPATFFTINAVLAKLDGKRARPADPVRLAALTSTPSLTDAQPDMNPAPTVGTEAFGLFTFRAPDGVLWRKWRSVAADMAKDQAVLDGCRSDAAHCPAHAAQFLRLINAVATKSGRARLEEANQSVNQAVRYVSDLAQFGELDRWSGALSTFATGKGDCEDYAIAKYVTLREAGFPKEDLRILLVRDRSVRQDHAVLAARLDGHWLILDNRWSVLREDTADLNFVPLFAINDSGVHMFARPYAQIPAIAADAAPAAASDTTAEWGGLDLPQEPPEEHGGALGRLPLLL